MNRNQTTVTLLIRSIFIASLCCALFALFQIIKAEHQVKSNLKQWDQIMAADEQSSILQQTIVRKDKLQVEDLLATELQEMIPHNDTKTPEPLYNTLPSQGELIGKIMIHAIDKELPIIHGTDEQQLSEGVGHYIGSALPGESDHVILAGHRDTVFRGLGQVEIGDTVEIETVAGVFTYQVEKLRIVDSYDRTVIVPSEEPLLTLITCYPFDYVGSAPQRYIVTGKLIEL